MFSSRVITASKAVRGVRFNSTVAKASAVASGAVSKASGKFIMSFDPLESFFFSLVAVYMSVCTFMSN